MLNLLSSLTGELQEGQAEQRDSSRQGARTRRF